MAPRRRHHRPQERGRWSRRLVWVALLVAVVLIVSPELRTRCLLAVADAWTVVRPPRLHASADAIADDLGSIADLTPRERRLIAECLKLRAELQQLRPVAAATGRLIQTDAVAAQVLWTSREARSAVVALMDETASPEAFVVSDNAIDVGLLDGIEVDGLVLTGRSVVGRVEKCGTRSCAVVSVTDSEFQVTAEIVRQAGESYVVGARGTYEGDGEIGGLLKHIPAELPVSVGDEVFTTPDSIWSGERLHLGTITAAHLPAGEPHWQIQIQPSGQLVAREQVYVLRSRSNVPSPNPTAESLQSGDSHTSPLLASPFPQSGVR